MKTLIVMRHAKSSWDYTGVSDHNRPLKKRGKQDAPMMGRVLYENDLTPDLILTSSAKRARDTAEAAAGSSRYDGELVVLRELYGAGPGDYIEEVRDYGGDNTKVMVVGHNPGIEDLVEELSGRWERMPTASVAIIELPINDWSQLTEQSEGKLMAIWLPREIKENR